jgi:type I restriction enzyme S subunit
MAGEWTETTLGDAATLQRGFDLPIQKRKPGKVPIVSSSGISDYHSEPAVRGPGVVTGRYGTIGQVFLVTEDYWPLNTTLWVKDFHGNDPRFIAYLLKTIDFHSCSDKSSVPGVNRNDLHRLPVLLPPLPEQKRIAHILGTLDDKIELNRRMNATLEGMSRAIFKSWFVDFDPVRQKAAGKQPVGMDAQTAALFPDSFEDSEIGEVPKGWGVEEVRDFLSLTRESVDPGECPAETFDHYSIPAFDAGCWPSPDLGDAIKSQKLLVPPGCVLISKLNPRTPRVWIPQPISERRGIASTEFLVALPAKTKGVGIAFLFCFALSDSFVDYLASHASGTSNSHQRVRPDDFLSYKVVLPPVDVLLAFDRVAGPLLRQSSNARSESKRLAALRDTLLPKLLSGEIRVPEAEKVVEEAMT